ncbi:MAG TPA: porin [Bordetella sp.]|uniref:porin n=1 Tax=Bordetella sp. TaxID=28081 RepID=UPI002ED03C6D
MKKTLLAAALFAGFAGFAGAAQAETQVTLYGILDTGIQFANVKNSTGTSYTTAGFANGVESGPRWGMKGTEDLGGGTQATFQLESGYQVSNGKSNQGGRLFGRRAFLGLQNASWGMVRAGRGPTISTDMFQGANSDPFNFGFGQFNLGTIATSLNTYRTDNQLSYMSPVFAGFQVGAGYSFNVDDVGNTSYGAGKRMGTSIPGIDVAATYTNGPLFAGLTYSQTEVRGKGSIRQIVADASYDFQVVRVYGAYVRGWNGLVGAGSFGTADTSSLDSSILTPSTNSYASGMKQNAFMLGLSAPVGTATSLFATYQHQTLSGAGANTLLAAARSAQNTFAVGAQYKLSKRTDVYAAVGYVDGFANVQGQKETTGVVGMRHQF